MASARAGMVPKENVNANTGNASRSTGALRPRPHAGDAAMAELTEQVTLYTADFCTPCISSGRFTHTCCSLPCMAVRLTLICRTTTVMMLSMSLSTGCVVLTLESKRQCCPRMQPEAEGRHGGAGAGNIYELAMR